MVVVVVVAAVADSHGCEHETHCILGQEIGNMFAARASLAVVIEMLERRRDSVAAAAGFSAHEC
jgi:hypothetical protein